MALKGVPGVVLRVLPIVSPEDSGVTARPLGRCHGMTKTQRILAAFALAGAAAGLAAPAASADTAPTSPLTLPDVPIPSPGTPAGVQPASVQEVVGKVGDGANGLNALTDLPNQLAPVIAPVQPLTDLAGAIQ
ncbi:hypothetical protein [Streptomyces erythrochromogenes]|uniref:hypothetical protein n=1 Tax=Streptomyces erythrochromogenes TaxID=285574 RepID=UPI00381D36D6|nr:hypothetical protein OG489_19545 [Streptomyces erythrochromogenes]